jgi:hypothetical protein
VWIDVTGGDVCSGNWATGANENQPHHAGILSEQTIRLDSKSVDELFVILDEYEEMALGYWDEEDSEEPDAYPEMRNGVRLLRSALLLRES